MGALLRAGAAADFASYYQGAQARLRGVVVRGHGGLGHKNEEFVDVLLNAPAQLALDRRRVFQEGAALGQQLSLQPPLGPLTLPGLGMDEGLGRQVNPVD